jgi:hypothetical protein
MCRVCDLQIRGDHGAREPIRTHWSVDWTEWEKGGELGMRGIFCDRRENKMKASNYTSDR